MVTVTAGGFVVLAAALAIMAPEIVEVLARPGYEVAAVVLPIVAFASAFQGLYTMFVSVIFLRRRTVILPLITAASAAVNIGLNLLLIPILGVVGAAWSTLAAYVLFAALTYVAASRMYPIRPEWGRLAGIFVVGVGGSTLGYVLSVRSTLGSTIADLAAFAVTATICLLLVRAPVARLRHLGPLLDAARGSGLETVPATS
jgi:O-antigen/teichoic acid export membrane protein